MLLTLARAADARDWVIARSPGFLVVSDAGEKKARVVAHQFEQVRSLFRQVFKARVDAGRLVVVYAVKDEGGLKELLGDRGRRPMPAGVFMEGTDKHFVALRFDVATPNPYAVIYHEYVHLLARQNFRWLPVWLSEGLAEFYATADIDDAEVRWGQVSPHHVRVLLSGTMIPLAELTSAGHDSPLYNEASRVGPFYAQSAMLTHYLFFADERRGQLGQFVKLLEQDVPEADAMRQAFGDLKKLQRDLYGYSRQLTFKGVKAQARLDTTSVQSLPLQPAEADSLRGDFLVRLGRLRAARALLEDALKRDPEQPLAHEALGVLESLEGRRAEALRHLTEAARLAPISHVAPFHLGLLEIRDDPADRDRRQKAFRSAIQKNPGFAPAHAALARLLLTGNEPKEEAVTLAANAAALDPGTAGYRVLQWHALERMGRKEEAARIEEPLRRAALADGETLNEMVSQLEGVGRPDEAEALLKAARATNTSAAYRLGYFLSEHERWDEAEAVARDLLAREPKSITALNNLAYVLAEAGRSLEEALGLVQRALEKSPKNAAYLDTKGFILFRMKRLVEAEAVLREATVEYPDPVTLDHIGDVLLERGKRDEALAEYERALESPSLRQRLRESIQAKINRMR